jgi:hypothetical protein
VLQHHCESNTSQWYKRKTENQEPNLSSFWRVVRIYLLTFCLIFHDLPETWRQQHMSKFSLDILIQPERSLDPRERDLAGH